MAKFVKGDVVVVPFPFSDLTHSKRRPALVVSKLEGDDLILCDYSGLRFRRTCYLHFFLTAFTTSA